MTSVLVADRVERKGRDLSEDREVTLGGLASDIFPDGAHANNRRAFKYLSRAKPEVRDGLGEYLGYEKGKLKAGRYEEKLIDLLINSKEPVICMSGPMGSGNSSIITRGEAGTGGMLSYGWESHLVNETRTHSIIWLMQMTLPISRFEEKSGGSSCWIRGARKDIRAIDPRLA